MTESEQLQEAIAAQENLRGIVPDAIIDATIAALQKQLAELQAAAAPEQQRKLVTVLFADVASFTALSENMDAEEITGLMNAMWQQVDEVITAHNGRIDKHIGDAVMALWGTETAREDDAEQAIRAALAMQAALTEFTTISPCLINMHIGINTGPVLLGQIGRTREFTAMGDTVNVASRLETAASGGVILISHATYSQVRGVFDVRELEPIRVKGKQEPVQVYEVLRAKPRAFRMGTRGVEGVETRMIGRDAELNGLQEAFLGAVEGGETRVVTVVGEAGVGKSRLLYEFDNWLELRPERIIYFKGRASADLERVAHSLFRDVFASRFDIRDSDSTAVALGKFRAGFTAPGGLTEAQADVAGHWLGFDFSSSPAVANLLGSDEFAMVAQSYLLRYFRALSAAGPVAVFLEDIHWADDQSLDLIAQLWQAIPQAPLLLVTLTRPALFERRPSWGADEAILKRIDLTPLSKSAGRELVDEILQRVDTVPEALRETIVESAEGNPFYTEELVKMFIEEGVIVSADGTTSAAEAARWRVEASKLSEAAVPPTLTGLLQARLDGLPLAERDLLQRAAVVGRLFWDGVVADLAQMPQDELGPVLEAIRGRELIFQREQSAFDGSAEYVFKHSLLRDVAYERVLLKYRQKFHGLVARWLEAHAGERISEYLSLIARHYQLAGEEEQAASYLLRAGQEGLRACAFRAGRDAFEQALDLSADDRTAVEAAIGLSQCCRLLGDLTTAQTALDKGLAGAHSLADAQLLARALITQSEILDYRGQKTEAVAAAQEALSWAREAGGAVLAHALVTLGGAYWELADLAPAAELADEGLQLARENGYTAVQAQALNLRTIIAAARGDAAEAERLGLENLAFARATGNLEREAIALLNLGSNIFANEQAYSYSRAALPLMRELGHKVGQAIVLANLAEIEAEMGNMPAAYHATHEAMRLATELDNLGLIQFAMASAAAAIVLDGERERGLAILSRLRDTDDLQLRDDVDEILEQLEVPAEELAQVAAAAQAIDLEAVRAELYAAAEADPQPYT